MDNDSTVFVGLDVHKDTIAVARVGSATSDPVIDVATIGTQQYAIDRMVTKLSGHGPLQFVYEAGPCGFWLHRYLTGKGQRCMVAAPSLIPKRPGDRIKTDRRDARNLALGLRAGTLTAVHIPGPEQEAFRDVVRAWQQSKRDVAKGKQRLKALLLRNDLRYAGKASWSEAHRRWLATLVLPSAAQQVVFQELVDTITEREARRSRFEAQMAELAPSWSGYPAAQALLAFRGVQQAVAYGVVAEAGDFARFSHTHHRLESAAAPHPQVPAHACPRQATQRHRHRRRPRTRRLPLGCGAHRRDHCLINVGGVQPTRTGDRATRVNVMRPGSTRRAFLECGQAR